MNIEDVAYLNAVENVEEAELLANRGPPRLYESHDPFEEREEQFIQIYRLTKNDVNELIDLMRPFMIEPNRVSALNIERKVLTPLRFFGSGSYQMDIGRNLNHAVSQASVSRCIDEVTNALNNPDVFNRFMKLPPSVPELNSIRNRFFGKYGLPGVIGCIDCTHVAIFPPKSNDPNFPEVAYVNRKGYHSINTQLICDDDLRILNVSAPFPGSSNCMHVWNNSSALQYITDLHGNGYNSFYFIGNSGYYLRPWLMKPIADAIPGSPEDRYNTAFKTCRCLIEQCNGVLKMRFRCLLNHRSLHYHPQKAGKIVNVCTVLHNMCINNNNPPPPPLEPGENVDFGLYNDNGNNINVQLHLNPDLIAGEQMQRRIVRNYF